MPFYRFTDPINICIQVPLIQHHTYIAGHSIKTKTTECRPSTIERMNSNQKRTKNKKISFYFLRSGHFVSISLSLIWQSDGVRIQSLANIFVWIYCGWTLNSEQPFGCHYVDINILITNFPSACARHRWRHQIVYLRMWRRTNNKNKFEKVVLSLLAVSVPFPHITQSQHTQLSFFFFFTLRPPPQKVSEAFIICVLVCCI